MRDLIERLTESLTTAEWAVWDLMAGDAPATDAAEQLGISPVAFRSRASRLRRKLRPVWERLRG